MKIQRFLNKQNITVFSLVFFYAGEAVKFMLCILCYLHAMKVAEAISFMWFMCINCIWCVLINVYLIMS